MIRPPHSLGAAAGRVAFDCGSGLAFRPVDDAGWKRIQKLEAEGIIKGRVALLDPKKLGLGLTVFVSIETADHSEGWLARFAEVVSAMPEVMEFYRMAGDVDYMLRVVVADMDAYDAFYKRLIAQMPLKNVTSRFAMERIKQTTALPIQAGKP